jgi:CRISPR-associated exonuclease Cas4
MNNNEKGEGEEMENNISRELLPLSGLSALEYCPRRFFYQIVQGEFPVEEVLLEGPLGGQTAPGLPTTRLYVASEALRFSGFVEVWEERPGLLIPLEYVQGEQGQWLQGHLQLCAQALCLEERQPSQPPIPYGYLLERETGRRVKIPLTRILRATTRDAMTRAWQLTEQATPPPPLDERLAARCQHCPLHDLCMPEEIRALQAMRRNRSS